MKTLFTLLTAGAMTISAPAAAQSAIGDWQATLDAGGTPLRIVVHITQSGEGGLTGTSDSPDQGAFGMLLGEISTEPATLAFTVPSVGARYSGTWNEASKSWEGEFRQGAFVAPLVFSAGPPPEPLPANWVVPADDALAGLIDARIAPRAGQGLVIGVLEPGGGRIVARGPEGGAAFDGSTLFEIGSISKVFTALILADMATKGEVSLDDPAEKFLPAGATVPERNGRKITLRDLSTHTSGLPRLPDNMPFGDPDDPYADYTEALMLAFLAGYELPRDIGQKWEYSNLGVGLLGYLLGRAAGSDYETLLRERITGPLGMADTSVALTPDQQVRFAPAYDTYMRPAKPWHLPALVGAGGIRSTTDDMLKFAGAILDPASPIGPAMAITLGVREETGNERAEQALGWQVFHPEPGREIVMHGGGTGGFRTHLALEPSTRRAVVALANSAAEPSAADLAIHTLIGSPVAPTPPVPPAPPPPAARTEVDLPTAELERVAGRYDFGSGVVFNVKLEADELRAQREGAVVGPVLPIYPEAPLRFFWRAVDAQVRFTTDDSGKVTGAEFSQGGVMLTGKRIEP